LSTQLAALEEIRLTSKLLRIHFTFPHLPEDVEYPPEAKLGVSPTEVEGQGVEPAAAEIEDTSVQSATKVL